MDAADIYQAAALLLPADLTEAQSETLRRCAAAAKQICRSRLRGELTEETAPVFEQACALMAAGLYLDGSDTGSVTSFTAGKLSVTTGGQTNRAQRLKASALELLAPLSADGGAFLGVRG